MLSLRNERLTHRVTFEVFREKMTTYVVSEFKNAKDILSVLKKMKDPMADLKTIVGPTELIVEEKKHDINIELQKEKVKLYAVRERQAYSNLDNLYGQKHVWTF